MFVIGRLLLRVLGFLMSACGLSYQQQTRSHVVRLVHATLPRALVKARLQKEKCTGNVTHERQKQQVVLALGPLRTSRAVEVEQFVLDPITRGLLRDRKSTRLNSSH
jgi:hypothetical protein